MGMHRAYFCECEAWRKIFPQASDLPTKLLKILAQTSVFWANLMKL